MPSRGPSDMAGEARTLHGLGREATLAMRAVADAIRLARCVEHDAAAGALAKSDASPVTIADFAVQAIVAARLAGDVQDDALVAEESADALRAADAARLAARVIEFVTRVDPGIPSGRVLDWIDRGGGTPGRRFWTLDPIDGTKGLLRGGQYAIALALIADGAVQLGVLGCPRLSVRGPAPVPGERIGEGGIAVAVRDRGAWWTPAIDARLVRLSASTAADATGARVLHSFEASHSDVAQLERVLAALGVERPPMPMDSQAKHVVVAAGEADLLLRFPTGTGVHDAIWDQAAGSLLIEEAGGRVTDLAGRALDFSTGRRLLHNEGLVASNGRVHDAVVTAIRWQTPPA